MIEITVKEENALPENIISLFETLGIELNDSTKNILQMIIAAKNSGISNFSLPRRSGKTTAIMLQALLHMATNPRKTALVIVRNKMALENFIEDACLQLFSGFEDKLKIEASQLHGMLFCRSTQSCVRLLTAAEFADPCNFKPVPGTPIQNFSSILFDDCGSLPTKLLYSGIGRIVSYEVPIIGVYTE
jgi:hypothetical protein